MDTKKKSSLSHRPHGHPPVRSKVGVLFLNLGTPDAPTPKALYRYLKEFLSDPRVIELPTWRRWLVLHLFVLPFRPKQSAELYKKVWTEEGSPLRTMTYRQASLLKEELSKRFEDDIEVEVGMRYGNPSIPHALSELKKRGVERLLVLPLYPQYSGTTTSSTFDAVFDELKKWRVVPELRTITSFYDDPDYIQALANSVRRKWEKEGEPEKLLISFHGIPQRYFTSGDPYYCHCQKTARLLAEALNLPKERYVVTFQSLFGKEEWLRPYTDETMKELGKSNLRCLDVVCPGFVSDCLETLEEVNELNRHFFLDAGGKEYRYIPCLNDDPELVSLLANLVSRHLQGWPITEQALSTVKRASQATF